MNIMKTSDIIKWYKRQARKGLSEKKIEKKFDKLIKKLK
jgi:hypothetical protein